MKGFACSSLGQSAWLMARDQLDGSSLCFCGLPSQSWSTPEIFADFESENQRADCGMSRTARIRSG